MKKHILALYLILYTLILVQTASAAADTPIASSSQEITTSVVENIKSVVKNSATPSANTTSTLLGLVGTVKTLTNNSLTVVTNKDTVIQAVTDIGTVIVSGSKNIALKDIPISSKVILIGNLLNAQDILNIKRLIVVPANPNSIIARASLAGTIIKVDNQSKTITITNPDQTISEVNITKKSLPTIKDFQINQKFLGIVKTDKDNSISLIKAKVW